MRDLIKRRRGNGEVSPWRDFEDTFDRLQNEINDLFEGTLLSRERGLRDRGFAPSVDVVENSNDIRITCDLPGVDKNDVDVSLSGNVLTIHGEKKGEEEKTDARIYRKENWYGSFRRSLTLPAYVDRDKIDAEMKNGVLKLTLPKKEEAKQKQITVNVQ